jgi:hypothetical protein
MLWHGCVWRIKSLLLGKVKVVGAARRLEQADMSTFSRLRGSNYSDDWEDQTTVQHCLLDHLVSRKFLKWTCSGGGDVHPQPLHVYLIPQPTWQGCRKFYIWCRQLTNSMQQSPPLEANSYLASQKLPRVLRNLNVICRLLDSPPEVLVLSQMNSSQILSTCIFKINFILIVSHTPVSFKHILSVGSSHQSCVHSSFSHTYYMPHSSHSSTLWPEY